MVNFSYSGFIRFSAGVKRATLEDVARLAGVAPMTVSRTINGHPYVAEDTAKKVRTAIRRLDYRPNHAARMLTGQLSRSIGLIVPDIADTFFSVIIRAVQETARESGYLVWLAASDDDPSIEAAQIQIMIHHPVDGILLVPADSRSIHLKPLVTGTTPIIAIDRPIEIAATDSIGVENAKGAQLAVEHLIQHGYKKITCLAFNSHLLPIKERIAGYRESMKRAKLPCPEELPLSDDTAARFALAHLFNSRSRPEALFTANNAATIWVIEALRDLKVEMGKDIAVVGFDDVIPFFTLITPPVTALSQPAADLGSMSARLLLQRIRGELQSSSLRMTLPVILTIRGSCGCKRRSDSDSRGHKHYPLPPSARDAVALRVASDIILLLKPGYSPPASGQHLESLFMTTRWRQLSLLILVLAPFAAAQSSTPRNLVLDGEVHPWQNQTYIDAPFTVPTGVHRITVSFHNLGRDDHTVLDLGIADPFRFRGASGGNKDHYTLSETDATPSYLAGALPAGQWKLLIAVPNIRPSITSRWRAEVWFNRALDDSSFTEQPLREQPGWYRGDLHMRDAHSDGSCPSQNGKSVPCPLFLTVEAAARRGLDFIAVSDHNTSSQYDDEREIQPYFDKLLLLPGRELTTFHGHANAFGTSRFIDYRVGTPQVPDVNAMFRSAHDLGAIVSINHPEAPTGEICMGCGWTPTKAVDMDLVTSIEVVNGGGNPATHFWEQQLLQGRRLTAIGGSDNHHADWPQQKPGSIGYPTTVIYAQNLSVAGILDGIRSGRVFIDVTGSRDRLLDMNARAGSAFAAMGGDLEPRGDVISLEVHAVGCEGGLIHFFVDGEASPNLPSLPVSSGDQTLGAKWHADGGRHFLRVEARDQNDHLLLLSNPIYFGYESRRAH